MKTIYVDDMFILNLVINYLLLVATAKLCALPLKRLRALAAAALGALYAVALLLPRLYPLASPVIKLSLGFVMILICFGSAKRIFRVYLAFLAVSAAFAGAVIAATLISGRPASGGFYIGASMKTLILAFAACYAVLTLVFSRLVKRRARETCAASLTLCQRQTSFTALRDTGNELYDPVSALPVIVAGADVASALLPPECSAALCLGAPELLRSLQAHPQLAARFRLVPYRAVGTDSGLLPVFRPDSLSIGGREVKDILVGLTPVKLCPDDEYSAII